MPAKLSGSQFTAITPEAKLSQGISTNTDLCKMGAGLTRGPKQSASNNNVPWTNTWPATNATLDIDFANDRSFVKGLGQGNAFQGITYTRASNGTYVGSNGLLQGSGSDKGALGLNLLTFPQNFENAAWSKVGFGATAPTYITYLGTLPDGTTGTIYRFTFYTAASLNSYSIFYQNTSTAQVNGLAVDFSLYMKQVSGGSQIGFNIESTAIGPNNISSIQTLTSNWARYSISGSVTNAQGFYGPLIGFDGRIPAQVGLSQITIDIWGAQLELGSTATQYFPTNINTPRIDWASTAQLALINYFLYTELLTNSYWATTGSAVVINQGSGVFRIQAPAGTWTVLGTSSFGLTSLNQTVSFEVMSNNAGLDTFRLLISGIYISSDMTATNSWVRYSFTSKNDNNNSAQGIIRSSTNTAIDILVRFPQFQSGNSFTTYQAIGNAYPSNTPLLPTTTANGFLIEESRANTLLWCRDATNAVWTKTNITPLKDQVGIDGVANACSSLIATNANGTCIQTVTATSASKTSSVYLKRITGTGTIQITMDGTTYATVDLSNGIWNRIAISATLANPTVGIKIVTSGDAVAMDYGQIEAGVFVTTPILTTTTSATRAVDISSMPISYTWYNQGGQTVLATIKFTNYVPSVGAIGGIAYFGSPSLPRLKFERGANSNRPYAMQIYDGVRVNGAGPPNFNDQSTGVNHKIAFSYDSCNAQMSVDGLSGVLGISSSITLPNASYSMYIGYSLDSGLSLNGYISRVIIFPKRLNNIILNNITGQST